MVRVLKKEKKGYIVFYFVKNSWNNFLNFYVEVEIKIVNEFL